MNTYRAKHSYEIYAVEVCSPSQICLWGRINDSIKIMVLQNTQYTNFCSVFGIVSQLIIIMLSGSIVFVWAGCSARNFWCKSVDQSNLEDQDKQQIGFFVIRFTVKYSDRLVATTTLKVLRSVCLSQRLCKTLVQFVTFMLFSGHLGICFTLPTAAVFAF